MMMSSQSWFSCVRLQQQSTLLSLTGGCCRSRRQHLISISFASPSSSSTLSPSRTYINRPQEIHRNKQKTLENNHHWSVLDFPSLSYRNENDFFPWKTFSKCSIINSFHDNLLLLHWKTFYYIVVNLLMLNEKMSFIPKIEKYLTPTDSPSKIPVANLMMKNLLYNELAVLAETSSRPQRINTQQDTYAFAIERLNKLQSNANYIKNASYTKRSNSLDKTNHYLSALDIKPDNLNKLNIIHIAGTKGKGSTCAYVESILRAHGYKTGFFSSPHLVVVRERIRINGKPIPEDLFSRCFDFVYNRLEKSDLSSYGMPGYFNFLTVMAFYVFLEENVDVAIMEVGIGGELDCTNVVQKPIVTGVTSLDLDHCKMLGNTLTDIAWQKAGIFKKGVPALTVPQPEEAMKVLKERAEEIQAPLYIVPQWSKYTGSSSLDLGIKGDAQKLNASLAVQLVNFWFIRMNLNKKSDNLPDEGYLLDAINLDQKYINGLTNTVWRGRCDIICREPVTYFLDAAHTADSMYNCAQWFLQQTSHSSNEIKPKNNNVVRILVFNCTGERNPKPLLSKLSVIDFDMAIFTTNRWEPVKRLDSDCVNFTTTQTMEDEVRSNNAKVWNELKPGNKMIQVDCIKKAISEIESISGLNDLPVHVLVCGSVHLVGGFIGLLEPDFINFHC